jgi:hypothetical protein
VTPTNQQQPTNNNQPTTTNQQQPTNQLTIASYFGTRKERKRNQNHKLTDHNKKHNTRLPLSSHKTTVNQTNQSISCPTTAHRRIQPIHHLFGNSKEEEDNNIHQDEADNSSLVPCRKLRLSSILLASSMKRWLSLAMTSKITEQQAAAIGPLKDRPTKMRKTKKAMMMMFLPRQVSPDFTMKAGSNDKNARTSKYTATQSHYISSTQAATRYRTNSANSRRRDVFHFLINFILKHKILDYT